MSTPAITVKSGASVSEIASTLLSYEISALPVVNDDGKIIGIVSEGDLVPSEQVEGRRASDVMTSDVVTAEVGTLVAHIADLMLQHGVGSIPVVQDGEPVGMVARRDLLKVLAHSDEQIQRQLENIFDGDDPDIGGPYDVQVSNGRVTLAGVANAKARTAAGLIARAIPGVVGVEFADG